MPRLPPKHLDPGPETPRRSALVLSEPHPCWLAENCMVERKTGILKIIDFGLSKHQQSAVTLGVGTPDYMAPELLGNGTMQTLQERRVGQ